jgi:hypothetical protein
MPPAGEAQEAERDAPRSPVPPEQRPAPRTRPLSELLEAPRTASQAAAVATPEPTPQAPAKGPAPIVQERVPHKHSMSLIGRIRFRRKQRKAR